MKLIDFYTFPITNNKGADNKPASGCRLVCAFLFTCNRVRFSRAEACMSTVFFIFQVINMSSSRNMAIVGLSIMLGIMIPTYIKETKNPINTGKVNYLSK